MVYQNYTLCTYFTEKLYGENIDRQHRGSPVLTILLEIIERENLMRS